MLTFGRHTHPSASTGAALHHCLSDLILGWGAGCERRQTVMLLPVWRCSTCCGTKSANGPDRAWSLFPVWVGGHALCPGRTYHLRAARVSAAGLVAEGQDLVLQDGDETTMAFKTMPIAKLQDLKSKIEAAINAKVSERRRELEAELAKLAQFDGRGGEAIRSETVLRVGDLRMDLVSRTVTRCGRNIELLPREFQVLEYLVCNQGQVVPRAMLLQHVWDLHFDPTTNIIDVYVGRVRRKVDDRQAYPLIHTIRGVGYQLQTDGTRNRSGSDNGHLCPDQTRGETCWS